MNSTDSPAKVCTHWAFTNAMCLDLPYILDSVWRHAEYDLNRLFSYRLTHSHASDGSIGAELAARRYVFSPAFWFFAAMLIFVAYGSTFDSLCSVIGASGMYAAHRLLGGLAIAGALGVWVRLGLYGLARARKRLLKAPVPETEKWRRRCVHAGVQIAVFFPVGALAALGAFLWRTAGVAVCHPVPSDHPAQLQLLVAIGVLVLHRLLAGHGFKRRSRLRLETLLLIVMVAVLWGWAAPVDASEAKQTPYPHVYGVFACALALLTLLAPHIARAQLGSVTQDQKDAYRKALRGTELFPGSRTDPELSDRRIIAAATTGVFYHLGHFLLLPSLFSLMVPSRYLVATFSAGCLLAAWLLMTGNFTSRWQAMVEQVRRWFLLGTPLAVSLAVIALALMRLARVQYVATVLDAAPFGVIFVWIVMAYVLLWWFEFSVNGSLAAELLGVFGAMTHEGRVTYLADSIPALQLTVAADHRYIVAHGAGRFAALGWFRDKDTKSPTVAFQTFDLVEMFSRLTPSGFDDFWHDLKRRIQLYFLTVNFLVIAIVFAGTLYYGRDDLRNTVAPVVSASTPGAVSGTAPALNAPPPLTTLAALLRDRAPARPAFIVAASGGGTRAALFTATALEGLRKLQVAGDIVLISGVSGGGVAAAYFYAHRDELLADGAAGDTAWQLFKEHMTEPFIGDVLEGAGELRVMSRQPLGRLLAESFERRLFDQGGRPALLGATDHMGLILNTTITAHPQEDSDLLRGTFSADDAGPSCNARHMPYAMIGGGRLVFTNLADRAVFPPSGAAQETAPTLRIPDVRLPFVVIQDTRVPLANAAALNANFPPVFTNARVDVTSENPDAACPMRSYYVTDGGAHENLGLVSALYALRGALEKLPRSQIPPLHIVTIEASSAAYDYTPDRGIDAATGGSKERLTGGLTQELLDDVARLSADGGPSGAPGAAWVQIHDLALPLAFRSRGGFGTHWMFPESITVANPRRPHPTPWYRPGVVEWFAHDPSSTTLDKRELIDLWTGLHAPDQDFCTAPWTRSKRRIADWICGNDDPGGVPLPADIHIVQWRELVASLHRAPVARN